MRIWNDFIENDCILVVVFWTVSHKNYLLRWSSSDFTHCLYLISSSSLSVSESTKSSYLCRSPHELQPVWNMHFSSSLSCLLWYSAEPPSVSCRYDGQVELIRITVVTDVVGRAPAFLAGHPLLSTTTAYIVCCEAFKLNQSVQHHTSQSWWAKLPLSWQDTHRSLLRRHTSSVARHSNSINLCSIIHRSPGGPSSHVAGRSPIALYYDSIHRLLRGIQTQSICAASYIAVLVGQAPTFLAGHPSLSATSECLATEDARQPLVFFITRVVFCDALHSRFPRLLNTNSRRTRWSSNTRTSL